MAKYAQGYERKNSDSKNLIIMGSIIVAVIALAIGFVILYNNVFKKESITFATAQYEDCYLTDYTKLLLQKAEYENEGETVVGHYYIYVCSKTGTSDTNMNTVLNYIDKTKDDEQSMKLFLLDYDQFDSTSDETESGNATSIENTLGLEVQSTWLIEVIDGEITNISTQVIKNSDTIKSKLAK